MPTSFRIFIISVVSLYFLPSFDGTRLVVSLPVMAEQFSTGTGLVSWILVAYLLAFISSMLILGRFSDIIDIRKIFTLGVFLFTLFSILCGVAQTVLSLIVFRFFQGLGGAMLVVASYSAVARYLSGDLVVRGYAALNIGSAIAMAIGAPVGGLITEYLGWRWNFYINLIMALCFYFIAIRSIPVDEKRTAAKPSIDIASAVSGFLMPFFFMLFISFFKELGYRSILLWAFLGAGVLSAGLFIIRNNRIANPLLDVNLFKIKGFGLMVILITIPIILQGGHYFLMPFYFDDIKNMRIVYYGALLMIYSLVFVITDLLSPFIFSRFHFRTIGTAGFICMMTGSAVMIFGLHTDGLVVPIAYLVMMGMGFGIYNAPSTSIFMNMVSSDRKGLFAGIFQIILRSSLAIGIILFETIYSAGIGNFSETLTRDSAISSDYLNALHFSYKMTFTASFFLIVIALIVLYFPMFKILKLRRKGK
ncbi:MAG: MFS transporter [Syntrophaceae bacterium]|nr:MFS transporter [Syntrophaceae bacterium]